MRRDDIFKTIRGLGNFFRIRSAKKPLIPIVNYIKQIFSAKVKNREGNSPDCLVKRLIIVKIKNLVLIKH